MTSPHMGSGATRFVDQAVITVQAGHGGKGCRSFYQDLWTRYPIPDGGDGGRGGHVTFKANPQLTTLLDFKTQRYFKAGSGGHGSSKRKQGGQGRGCVVEVPLGILLWDAESGDLVQEFLHPGEELVVARGGAGGIGNGSQPKDRQRRVDPRLLEGYPGEERKIKLELKLLTDAGIIGLPNAGKSTLIGRISAAKPKVAPFPFTTTHPVLGVVTLSQGGRIVAVDVPGLIEGAHLGKGLGLDFLRHIERTKVLVHLMDMAGVDGRDPLIDYRTLNAELKSYDPKLLSKPQILVANKMDLPSAQENLVRFRRHVKKKILSISAKEAQGIEELLAAIEKELQRS